MMMSGFVGWLLDQLVNHGGYGENGNGNMS